MKVFEENPYRVLGVVANASPSKIRESKVKIKRYLDIGKNAELDFDITPPLNSIKRTADLLEVKTSDIHADVDKVLHSLFWFIEGNSIDKIALNHLATSKDINKALDDFSKGCRDFNVSASNYSAIINHSTLDIIAYSIHKDKERVKNAIARKFMVLGNTECFKKFCLLVAPNSNYIEVQNISDKAFKITSSLLEDLFRSTNKDALLLDIFKENSAIYPKLKVQVIDAKVESVLVINRNYEDRIKEYSKLSDYFLMMKKGVAAGNELMAVTNSPLEEIADLVGENDPQYTDVLNEVYVQVNYFGLVPFSEMMDQIVAKKDKGLDISYDLKKINLVPTIDLYSKAKRKIQYSNIPIKDSIESNHKVIGEHWSAIKDAQNTISGSSTGDGYSGSSSSDDNSGIIWVIVIVCGIIGLSISGSFVGGIVGVFIGFAIGGAIFGD